MTQTQLVLNLTTWEVEILFYLAVVFAIVYGFAYKWWQTPTGRAVMALHIGIAFVLLRSMLAIWHIPIIHLASAATQSSTSALAWSWVTAGGLLIAVSSLATLLWQSISEVRYGPDLEYTNFMHKLMRIGRGSNDTGRN